MKQNNRLEKKKDFFQGKQLLSSKLLRKMIKTLILECSIAIILFGAAILHAREFKLDNNIKILLKQKHSIIDKFASEELKKHLLLAGAKKCDIEIFNSATPVSSGLTFYIGQAYSGFDKKLKYAEARYAIRDNKVYLWGENKINSRLTLRQILGG